MHLDNNNILHFDRSERSVQIVGAIIISMIVMDGIWIPSNPSGWLALGIIGLMLLAIVLGINAILGYMPLPNFLGNRIRRYNQRRKAS